MSTITAAKPAPRTARSRFDPRRDPILWTVGLLIALGMFLMALHIVVLFVAGLKEGMLLDAGVWSFGFFVNIFEHRHFLPVITNTLLLGVGSLAVMLFFTVPFAWLYTRTDLPGKNIFMLLITVKIAIPGFLVALGYIFLFNPSNGIANVAAMNLFGFSSPPFNIYTLPWIIFFQGTALATSAFFMIVPTFRAIDAALEEAALVSGVAKWMVTAKIVLPLAGPAIIATSVYYFIVAIESFDYAAMLGLPVRTLFLSTWIYRLVHTEYENPNYGEAAALGVLAVIAVGLLTIVYLWSIRRAEQYAVVTGKRGQQGSIRLSQRAKVLAWAFIGFYAAVQLFIPLFMLIWNSLLPYLQAPSLEALNLVSLRSYRLAFAELPPLLINTLTMMVAVPTLSIVIASCVAWLITRTQVPGRKSVELVVMGTLAVPSVVGALAFMYLGLSIYQIIPIYTTVWIMVVALGTRYITWANRTISSAMLQVHRELEEACSISGVSRGRAFLSVLVPTVAPALLFSWFWLALLTLRELTVPVMLARPDTQVLASAIWGFNASGEGSIASALGVILLVVIGCMVMIFHRIVGRVSI